MKTSLRGLQFVAAREAAVLQPYRDGRRANGEDRYSIGFGMLAVYGKDTPPVTVQMAWHSLRENLAAYEADVNRHLGGQTVTQQAFDALISLYYNMGGGNKQALMALIQAGDVVGAADMFLTFNKNAGVVSVGHTKRRIQERDLFLHGHYGDLSHILVWTTSDVKNTAPEHQPMPTIE